MILETRQGFTSVSFDMESALKFAIQANQGRSAKRSLLVIEDLNSGGLETPSNPSDPWAIGAFSGFSLPKIWDEMDDMGI